ncbi:MAG TPA: hypothetical protein DEB09_01970 [Candidatus Magasanikbacteria bacterium]|nr:hypothetical protein [Candidatus Magasanikbacteria bacterium]
MKIKINQKQKKDLLELEKWFDLELVKLRKRQLEILKKYDKRKSLLLQSKVLKNITDLKDYYA